MSNYAAAVRAANRYSRSLMEQYPGVVVAVAAKMINATDAAIFVGVNRPDQEGLPTELPHLDERDQETKERIPVVVEFVAGVTPSHRQGHR